MLGDLSCESIFRSLQRPHAIKAGDHWGGGADWPVLSWLQLGTQQMDHVAQMEGSRGQQMAIFPGSLCWNLGSRWVHSEGPGAPPGEGASSSRHTKLCQMPNRCPGATPEAPSMNVRTRLISTGDHRPGNVHAELCHLLLCGLG